MKASAALLFQLLLLCGAAAEESPRSWTDKSGRKFEGSYVSSDLGKVSIRRAGDGRVFEVDRTTLSQADLDYLDGLPKEPPRRRPHGRYESMLEGYDPAQSNFAAPWPTSAGVEKKPVVTVIEQNAAERRFIYETPHFRIQSNASLRSDLQADIGTLLEACFHAHRDIPLNNRRTRSSKAPKLQVFLFVTIEEYRAAGGMPGTVGMYLGRTDRLLVPLETLGVKKSGSEYVFDFNAGFHSVYHEISHLLWADLGEYAGMWMNEGFAEYMACAPYGNGRFNFPMQAAAAWEFAIGIKGKPGGRRDLGTEITMPHLQEFMNASQERFYEDPNKNYGLGLLLVYYFMVVDGDGKGTRFKSCVKACQDGKSREEALQILLGGRDYPALEKDFATALRNKGVQLTFR